MWLIFYSLFRERESTFGVLLNGFIARISPFSIWNDMIESTELSTLCWIEFQKIKKKEKESDLSS